MKATEETILQCFILWVFNLLITVESFLKGTMHLGN